jgi:hypothetical protein
MSRRVETFIKYLDVWSRSVMLKNRNVENWSDAKKQEAIYKFKTTYLEELYVAAYCVESKQDNNVPNLDSFLYEYLVMLSKYHYNATEAFKILVLRCQEHINSQLNPEVEVKKEEPEVVVKKEEPEVVVKKEEPEVKVKEPTVPLFPTKPKKRRNDAMLEEILNKLNTIL